jgi:hypothetical protein
MLVNEVCCFHNVHVCLLEAKTYYNFELREWILYFTNQVVHCL